MTEAMESPPECPDDWGAIRVLPETVEFWSQSPDRMHDRLLYARDGDGWRARRLAP
jgi:pyridoxamine 5'-phosphate oxidase